MWSLETCIQIPALTQTLCLTMGKMLNYSKPQALHPENGARVMLVILKDCPPYMAETARTHHHPWASLFFSTLQLTGDMGLGFCQ